MAKLTGAKKAAFLERMARGRRKAKRSNPPRKTAKKAAAKTKSRKKRSHNPKLTGAKKAAFLERMAKGRRKAKRGSRPVSNGKKKSSRAYLTALSKAARNGKQKRGRRNPDTLAAAIDKFEEFHQKAPGHILEIEQSYRYPQNFAEMGKLKELRFFLDDRNPDFPLTSFGDCIAVTTPDGSNIYFIGGDQSINFEALEIASDKDFVELGPCSYIMYDTVKGFHDFQQTNYWHRFGEEDEIFPRLGYDRLNKSLFLIGGNYRVRPEGIVN